MLPEFSALSREQTFEPMLHRLLDLEEKQGSQRIDEIWSFEAVQHGDSALINGDRPGCLCAFSPSCPPASC
jgi:hypothetical protein